MRRSWNTAFRRISSPLVMVVITSFALATPLAAANQVPFTASALP